MFYHRSGRKNGISAIIKNISRKSSRLVLMIFLHCTLFFFLSDFSSQYCLCCGLKYIKNYKTGIHPLNWVVTQDKRGIIYVANNGCVLEFDGVSQRIINIPDWKVRSIAVDNDGTLYIGGVNQLGYLAPGPNGSRQYVSLLALLTENQRKFDIVLRININSEGVYFRTRKFLFRWNPKAHKMDTWEPTDEFNASFTCGGKLYVHQRNVGLMQMVDDSLKNYTRQRNFCSGKNLHDCSL